MQRAVVIKPPRRMRMQTPHTHTYNSHRSIGAHVGDVEYVMQQRALLGVLKALSLKEGVGFVHFVRSNLVITEGRG